MKNSTIKTVVAAGIGAALWVAIGMLIQIPTGVPNTDIQLQYALQALFSLIYGPLTGFLVGFIGHAVKDAMTYGLWWTWILGSGAFGLIIGLFKNYFNIDQGNFSLKSILTFNGIQFLANIIAWGLVAPFGDILIYAQAAEKVFVQSLTAGAVNAISVAIGGTILISIYAKTKTQAGSLTKD